MTQDWDFRAGSHKADLFPLEILQLCIQERLACVCWGEEISAEWMSLCDAKRCQDGTHQQRLHIQSQINIICITQFLTVETFNI